MDGLPRWRLNEVLLYCLFCASLVYMYVYMYVCTYVSSPISPSGMMRYISWIIVYIDVSIIMYIDVCISVYIDVCIIVYIDVCINVYIIDWFTTNIAGG